MASSALPASASALALLAACLVLPCSLPGQEAPQVEPSPFGQETELVTLDFQGGTLSSYVDLLREKFDVNAVVAPEAGEFPMPSLSLKKVSVSTAMNLIEAMSRSLSGDSGSVDVNVLSDPEGTPVFIVGIKSPSVQTGLPGLPRIGATRAVRPGGGAPAIPSGSPVRTLQVFSIKLLTQPVPGGGGLPMAAENVLTAIDTALGLSGDDPAQIKFHPETGLLFVHGTPGQLEAVGTLIRTLNEDQSVLRRAQPADDLKKLIDRLHEENEKLRAQLAAMSAELEKLKSQGSLEAPRRQIPERTPRPEPTRP